MHAWEIEKGRLVKKPNGHGEKQSKIIKKQIKNLKSSFNN